MGYEVDVTPAKPWVPQEPTYLDAYKRRMYKSYHVKPKFEEVSDPRGFMETFETQEPLFRPIRRYINPENGYETPWKSCRGNGQYDIQSRIIHVGNNGTIVTPSGEWWKKGKRYFIPNSGSWTEPAFKPSLRYLATTLSDDQIWRPCVRVYKMATPHYFNARPIRRRYLPPQPGYDDKYERLTSTEAYSGIYQPREITDFKPECLGFSNRGVPHLRPFRKGVRMYMHRHPHMCLFPPDPPLMRRPLSKKVAGYSHKHPQLQLFSADFRPELTRSHPSYVSTSRYNPEGRYDHFEDRSFTIQPDTQLPEPLGAQPIPFHSPPYPEVKPVPDTMIDEKPTRLMTHSLTQKPSASLLSPDANKINLKQAEVKPSTERRPMTTETLKRKEDKRPQSVPDAHSRFMTEYMRAFNSKYLPGQAKAALEPWL